MTRVVLCLDKFRGSVTAKEACAAVGAGLRRVDPALDVVLAPIADGGEGTVDALVDAGWGVRTAEVTGPTGEPVPARLAVKDGRAVVELAQASGLHLVGTGGAAMTATTAGTGALIRRALDLGSRDITLTVGGSATTDGGAGMLVALGAQLLDGHGRAVEPGGAGLRHIAVADLTGLDGRLATARITVASDVSNPLLGPTGAAAVFAPQKGATPREVEELEAALTRYARVLAAATGRDRAADAGAGAGGGTAFAALSALRANPVAGVDFVLGALGIAALIRGSSLVVVGEGSLDAQSMSGKAPLGVAALAHAQGIRVAAVAGQVSVPAADLAARGIGRTYAVLERAVDLDDALSGAARILATIGEEIARELL
jgi:glycerate 2-kinase